MPEILLGYVRSIYVDQLGRDTLYSMIIMVMPIVPQLVSKLESYWLGYNRGLGLIEGVVRATAYMYI